MQSSTSKLQNPYPVQELQRDNRLLPQFRSDQFHPVNSGVNLAAVARHGRYGTDGVKDTRLAHITPREDALLRMFGGAGSINPKTGLPEYKYGGAGTTEGHGTRGVGARDTSGPVGGRGGGGQVSRDKLKEAYNQYAQGMTQAGMANLAGPPGYNGAVRDYNTRHWGWDVLDFMAGPFVNVNRPNPTIPGSYSGGKFHTSTNVPGAIGSMAGMGLGVPGLGWAASSLADAAGIPDVYHGSYDDGSPATSPANRAPRDNSASWGGGLGLSGTARAGNAQPSNLLGLAENKGLLATGILDGAPEAPPMSKWLQDSLNRQWVPTTVSVPGPSPYTVPVARWL